MTRDETVLVVKAVHDLWPHANLGDNVNSTVNTWHLLLQHFDVQDVQATVVELAATGREFAPPVGVLAKEVTERVTDAPDFDLAWRDVDRLIRKRGMARPPAVEDFAHPLVAQWALGSWKELCMGPAQGTNGYGTHYAQCRESYRALRARSSRDATLTAVGAPRRSTLPPAFGDVLKRLSQPDESCDAA